MFKAVTTTEIHKVRKSPNTEQPEESLLGMAHTGFGYKLHPMP